jgi:hypothetical protein
VDFWDFVTNDELDELPEDPEAAFIAFVRIAEARLKERLRAIGPRDQGTYEEIDDARYGFQNVVLGSAKKFGIEPFASLQMPVLDDHNDAKYRQFRHDLTHYITQLMLTTADRDRSNSVPLLDATRQKLETYIFHLRDAIKNSDLSDRKKDDLYKKLDALERELGRRRLRFIIVAGIVIHILTAPGELNASYDAVIRLTNSIMREIGLAKEADNEQRKISHDEPVALLPPRTEVPKPKDVSFDSSKMDDEIPF